MRHPLIMMFGCAVLVLALLNTSPVPLSTPAAVFTAFLERCGCLQDSHHCPPRRNPMSFTTLAALRTFPGDPPLYRSLASSPCMTILQLEFVATQMCHVHPCLHFVC